MFVMFFASQ